MKELSGRTAVVTGAASGIGLAIAERFVDEGMRVVLADIEADRLQAANEALQLRGGDIRAQACDVSNGDAVEALAAFACDQFGDVDVLVNNAGVFSGGLSWETPAEDWTWVLGVNLHGILNGIRSFVPRMQATGRAGHIVNVASMAGLTTMPMTSVYTVSKHAALALSECLHKELRMTGSKLRVSVLCPEAVNTSIADAERNRPDALRSTAANEARATILQATADALRSGVAPSEMADRVVRAIREERFYILSEDETWRRLGNLRCEDLTLGREPSDALPDVG